MEDEFKKILDEQRLEDNLSNIIKDLPRKTPPENLWLRIENEIDALSAEKRGKYHINADSLFAVFLKYKRPILVFTTLIIILVVLLFIKALDNNNPIIEPPKMVIKDTTNRIELKNDEEIIGQSIIQEKKRNSKTADTGIPFDTLSYQKKINKLYTTVNDKKNNLEPYLQNVYDERLSSINESISEISTNLKENKLNSIVRKSLLLAYSEKLKIFFEILEM